MKADLGEFVGRKYDVLLIDPPWSYYSSHARWGAAKKFYPYMEDNNALNIKKRASERILSQGSRLGISRYRVDGSSEG